MHEISFADAVRPTPVTVLKFPLSDYSLGHELILLKRRNPLLICSRERFDALPLDQQVHAVKNAVWVCCNDWRRNTGEWFAGFKAVIWRWRIRHENFPLAIAEFRNYLALGHQLPSPPGKHAVNVLYGKDTMKGRALGSPLLAQLYMFACSDEFREIRIQIIGGRFKQFFTGKRVWDIPYSLVGHFYFASLEMKGDLRIENEQEFEEQAESDRIEAAIKEEQKARSQRTEDRSRKPEDGGRRTESGLATEVPEELTTDEG